MGSDHDYKHGGWKDKYYIYKRCLQCGGMGMVSMASRKDLTTECTFCCGTGEIAVSKDAMYFVLRLDEDPHARAAALAYAMSIEQENPQFASDIRGRVAACENQES